MYAINTIFGAKDRVTKVFSRMSKGADKFGDSASKNFRKASRSGSMFKSVLAGILAASVISSGFGALKQGVASAATQFVTFDHAIVSASAKFKGLDLTTEAGIKTLEQLKKTARDVGATTQFSATEAGQGLDYLAMAGFNAQQSMAALPGVVDLSTVANVDLARATDIASDSLGAFGLMTEDNIQLQTNLTRINDVMAKTMTRTNTGLEDLFEAAKKGAPTFTSTGQSIESFNALLGIMANSGVKGEEAGTQLRNVMLSLSKPTKEASRVIDGLGVKLQDQKGDFRDVIDILGDFEKGLAGMGNKERAAAIFEVFGKRGVTGINVLLESGTDKLRSFRKELDGAGGSSKKMADIMRGSLLNRLKSVQSAAIELGFKFFEAFEKEGASAIQYATNALRNVDVKPVINGIKTTIKVFKGLYSIIEPFVPIMPVIVGGFLAYHTALKAIIALEAIKAFILFAQAVRTAAVAQGLLNVVMTANPIGAIIVGITALIAGIVLLVKNWDKVKAAFQNSEHPIGRVYQWFNKMLNNPFFATIGVLVAPFLTIPALIIKHWEPISEFFGGLFDKIATISGMVSDFTGSLFESDEAAPPDIEAPNKTDVEARQSVGFSGKLQIAGAPEGSTVESKTTGAPAIQMELLGAQ